MNIILELEIKLNYEGELDYTDERIHGLYTNEEVTERYNTLVDACIERGYFDKTVSRTDCRARLSNGGTATKYFIIKKL